MSDTPRARSTSGDSASDQTGDRVDRVYRDSNDGGGDLKVRHRPAWIAFVVLGAIFCLAMGYWQLSRYQAVSGTVQNLGYTFMWPFLAGFLIYAYLRYIRLEAEDAAKKAEDAARKAGDGGAVGEGPAGPGRAVGAAHASRDGDDDRHDDDRDDDRDDDELGGPRTRARSRGRGRTGRGGTITEIPADILPTRRPAPTQDTEDEALRAYNDYLAELARQDAEAARQNADAARQDAEATRPDAAPEENTRR